MNCYITQKETRKAHIEVHKEIKLSTKLSVLLGVGYSQQTFYFYFGVDISSNSVKLPIFIFDEIKEKIGFVKIIGGFFAITSVLDLCSKMIYSYSNSKQFNKCVQKLINLKSEIKSIQFNEFIPTSYFLISKKFYSSKLKKLSQKDQIELIEASVRTENQRIIDTPNNETSQFGNILDVSDLFSFFEHIFAYKENECRVEKFLKQTNLKDFHPKKCVIISIKNSEIKIY